MQADAKTPVSVHVDPVSAVGVGAKVTILPSGDVVLGTI